MTMYYVYKIYSKDESVDGVYVGVTIDVKQRKRDHKSSCYNGKSERYNMKVYEYIRENDGWDNFMMVVIVEVNCDSILERKRVERYYILKYGTLNTNMPRVIDVDCSKDDNKEWMKEYGKEYNKEHYEKNKKEILEKGKEKITCECGSVVRKSDISRHKKSQKHQNLMKNLN